MPDPRGVLSRHGADPDLVLRYGPEADHLIDVFAPPGPPTRAPLVVLLHGGFWQQEWDRVHVRPLADAIRSLGMVVAVPEYARVGGRGGWPGTFDDIAAVRTALPDLLAQTLPGRVALEPLTLVGHSAGGHLALWWAMTTPESPPRVVALAPVADLRRAYAEGLGDGAVAALLGGGPDAHPDRYAAVDPATAMPMEVTVAHGVEDAQVPVQHSRDLVGVRLVELPDVDHFALIDPLSRAWPAVAAAISS